MTPMEKMLQAAYKLGFRTVITVDGALYTIGFVKAGLWSPPFSGFTMEEAVAEATEGLNDVIAAGRNK